MRDYDVNAYVEHDDVNDGKIQTLVGSVTPTVPPTAILVTSTTLGSIIDTYVGVNINVEVNKNLSEFITTFI